MAHRMVVWVLAAVVGIPFLSMAEEQVPDADSGKQESIQAQKLAPDQLANLVAPIALYPDPLLSQVLVASTYPLEVVEAQQWLRRNERLKGQQLTDAARQEDWDASVQGLVAFPDVVATLNQDIKWTAALGNAFLAQQSDVMAAVQRMRSRAQANGKLSSTPQQSVTSETQDGQAAIEIVPAYPQVIYVPEYDPGYIWGPPAWGAYPALPYARYGFGFGPGIDIGFCFGDWGGWAWGWGWGPNWFGGSVFVNGAFFRHHGYRGGFRGGGFAGREAWQHEPGHRRGVAYPNGRLTARYQAASLASRGAMARSGSWGRPGAETASTYGHRSAMQGSRGAALPSARRTTEERWRGFQGASRSQAPAQRYASPAERTSPRAERTRAVPRMSGWTSGGRSFGGSSGGRGFSGSSGSSGYGGSGRAGGTRGTGGSQGGQGGHGSGGGSHGGGRHR